MQYVVGYASLLSEISIRRLFPNVQNITRVKIKNHARCFNSFGTLSIKAKLVHPGSRKLAHASAIYSPQSEILALAFELNDADYLTYKRHEFRYDLQSHPVISLETGTTFDAVICYENLDHKINTQLAGLPDIWALYDLYDVSSFWHTSHLPAEIYLEHCIAAAHNISPEFLENFLENSYIFDRETSILTYLRNQSLDVNMYSAAAKLSNTF